MKGDILDTELDGFMTQDSHNLQRKIFLRYV